MKKGFFLFIFLKTAPGKSRLFYMLKEGRGEANCFGQVVFYSRFFRFLPAGFFVFMKKNFAPNCNVAFRKPLMWLAAPPACVPGPGDARRYTKLGLRFDWRGFDT